MQYRWFIQSPAMNFLKNAAHFQHKDDLSSSILMWLCPVCHSRLSTGPPSGDSVDSF